MFTGIIEELGTLRGVRTSGGGRQLSISARTVLEDVAIGDSIAINGVCLTVTSFSRDGFTADAVEETVKKTTLGSLVQGAPLNLERALRAGGKLGGHYVQGHVDTTSVLKSLEARSDSWILQFVLPREFTGNVIPVGSIAIDGVSLTVAEKGSDTFSVSIIPHTFHSTLIASYRTGCSVNLEFDVIGKYVQSFVEVETRQRPTNTERLRELGY